MNNLLRVARKPEIITFTVRVQFDRRGTLVEHELDDRGRLENGFLKVHPFDADDSTDETAYVEVTEVHGEACEVSRMVAGEAVVWDEFEGRVRSPKINTSEDFTIQIRPKNRNGAGGSIPIRIKKHGKPVGTLSL